MSSGRLQHEIESLLRGYYRYALGPPVARDPVLGAYGVARAPTREGSLIPIPPDEQGYYLDSGYLAIGTYSTNTENGFIVARPVLYQSADTLLLSEAIPGVKGLIAAPVPDLQPLTPIDGETPPSYDYPANSSTLWEKVAHSHYNGPCNWSGKLRLFGQARLGLKSATSWSMGIPSTCAGSASGYGLYTDAQRRYWLIKLDTASDGTYVDVTATLLSTPLAQAVDDVFSNAGATNSQKLIIEAYALSLATKTATVMSMRYTMTGTLDGLPLSYQWHWKWDGSEAQIVLHKLSDTEDYFISKHFKLTLEIADNEMLVEIIEINSGVWAPGTSAFVFSPLADWSGSNCWGYGLHAANQEGSPLYCYIKSSGDTPYGAQEFISVDASFGKTSSVSVEYLSACHDIAQYENAFSSNTHGSVSAHTESINSIYAGGGLTVISKNWAANVYRLTRTNFSDYSSSSQRTSSSFILYLMNPTCGVAVNSGTFSGARTEITYIKTCTVKKENYLSTNTGNVLLIVPAGNPDACVIGVSKKEVRTGLGINVSYEDHRYKDRIEYNFDSGGTVVSTAKQMLSQYNFRSEPPTTQTITDSTAFYQTSFGGKSDTGNFSAWTSPASNSNSFTSALAIVTEGILPAARGAGASDGIVYIDKFPRTAGEGNVAILGFG